MDRKKLQYRELQSLNVLAVDDHNINCEFIQAALGPHVGALTVARNGRQAIELCAANTFDLVLMDLHMPDMDGITAWENISHASAPENLPYIIALTAENRPEELKRLRAAGFHGYLHKPVSLELLLHIAVQVAHGESGFEHLEDENASRKKLLDNERAIAVNGKAEHVVEMRNALAKELVEGRPALDQWMAEGSYEQAAARLHQWAGGAGYAGASGLQHACIALQACLQNELDSSPGTLYLEVLRRLDCTVAAIQLKHPIPV